ncbi:MBL fold metallo-hydrolase [Pararhizobium sp. BT-229]|uniref:MBL fold metallo-hydrolase n=1 Tax=Pararhizobium sp. BT-229 TaxID=2986923 RepID=UPI0021F7D190|nr:MBL fold metallo-hydrolase [Pararhizobium sp. BT-229]MCV9963971.1 MBL fold metallo-hydrolase [Pararhizobium sp. BT-229]
MKLESKLYVAGHCLSFAAATFKGDPWRIERYPAICARIRHPEHGHIVFDTGYSQAFFSQTRRFPSRLYRMATPVRLAPGESLADQLAEEGIQPSEIGHVILSHFHADHVGGLSDFPSATIIADTGGWAYLRDKRGFAAVRKGFVPGLIPSDFEKRFRGILYRRQVRLGEGMGPFRIGYDLFGDGSILAVYLEGHARHQVGILFDDIDLGPTFLCADAAWSRRAIRENTGPGRMGYMAVDDVQAADGTLGRLHELHKRNPGLRIVPSHCQEVWEEIKGGSRV